MNSIKQIYDQTLEKLNKDYEELEARHLTRMLFEEYLNCSFEQILAEKQIKYDSVSEKLLNEKIDQLLDFIPIQYVMGKAHFFGREFLVNRNVLIPRQETEELINEIIIDNKRSELEILDIGTGSGCIAITLGLELKNPRLTALDIAIDAIEVAKRNAKRFNLQMDFVQSDILGMEKLPKKYDIIVSNPPYVTVSEKSKMHQNVLKFEPHIALFVTNEDPLVFYRKIIELVRKHLNEGGKLYFEINERFGDELLTLLKKNGCTSSKLIKDLNGKDRILKARFN